MTVDDAPVGHFAGEVAAGEPPSAFYALAALPVGGLDCAAARGRLSRRGAGRCDELWLPDVDEASAALGAELVRLAVETLRAVNARWWRLDVDRFGFKLLRYGPGHSAPAHMDMFPGSMRRKLSLVVQMSDPWAYVGGDLELVGMGERWSTVPRQAGLAAVFPAWTRHRVTPVVSGERWTLAAWAYGPPVR